MSSIVIERLIRKIALIIVTLLIMCVTATAAEPMLKFATDQQAALYLELTESHRCLKCQNQNLADSSAGIAQDLKREIFERVNRGETGPQISAYLVERYGDFVRYKPAFKPSTYALWLGPFLLLFLAIVYSVRMSRRSTAKPNQPDNEALARARKLLDD